ncbi:MAG: hypothetical protein CL878_14160 [Dehalococcoidia bacterium]|nr:hypothetical protein [Dehalococcoidia bacterium]
MVEQLPVLRQQGFWACAISYDSVDVLAAFAERFQITYPLLSDVDSAVIQRFGILNANIPPDHPWHGVPYPGTYLVDAAGQVVARSFYADHAKRDALARMVEEDVGVAAAERGTSQASQDGPVQVRAALSSGTIRPGQVVTLTVELAIAAGYHLYGQPLPEGYVATELVVDAPPDVAVGEVTYPSPTPFQFAALGEVLPAYAGQVVLKAPIFSRQREDFDLQMHLRYQACDDHECLLPEQLDIALPVHTLPNVR